MGITDHGVPVVSSRQWTTGLSPNAAGTGWNFIVDYIGDAHPHQWLVLKNFTTSPIESVTETLQGIYPNTLYSYSTAKGQIRAPNGRIFFPQVKGYISYYDPVDEQIHQIGPIAEDPPINQNASTQFYSAAFDTTGTKLYLTTQESENRPTFVAVLDTDALTLTPLGYVGSGALSYTTYGKALAPDTGTATKFIYVAFGENPWQLWALNITDPANVIATKLYEVSSTGNIQFTNIVGQGWVATIDTALGQPGNVRIQRWCLDGALYSYTVGQPPPGSLARNVTPVASPLVNPPDIDTSAGAGRLRWRPHGSTGDYTTVDYTVNFAVPVKLESLCASNDGVVANAAGYLGVVKFVQQNNASSWFGAWVSGFSEGQMLHVDGVIYMAGYPNGVLHRYDPEQAWALGSNPPTTATNPKQLGAYGLNGTQFAGVKYVDRIAWSAALGRLYIAGSRERNGTGMGVGWWDKAKADANQQAFAGTYQLAGMSSSFPSGLVVDDAAGLVVVSTYTVNGSDALMFVLPPDLSSASTSAPLAGVTDLGQIFPTKAPGVVCGVVKGAGNAMALYHFDAVAGELLGYVLTKFVGTIGAIARHPNGSLWVMVGNQLVHVDVDALTATPLRDLTSIAPVVVSTFAADGTTLFMAAGAPNGIAGARLYSLTLDSPARRRDGREGYTP